MSKPKSIFISIDMEGISGIVDWNQVGGNTGEYTYGRKLMVGDLNAAIEGAFAAGAEEVVVSDAHGGMKNLQPMEVHSDAHLIRGSPKPGAMMEGIDNHYDAALYVGYHAMKGTEKAILAHTISGRSVNGVWINGKETGEFGLNSALAGCYGVPSVFVSGDAAVAEEVKSFVPNITTAVVKWAVGRRAAKCLHPKKAHTLIKKKVTHALANIEHVDPYKIDEPLEFMLKFESSVVGDIVALLPYIERIDGRTVKAVFDDYPTAIKALRGAIYLGGVTARK
ncbi:MAG: M55 family metallopeptidase [Candidatus Bathyarchaeota archaeon]|jgi:D-amino peptidase|nr:M55 family metallopeptidase [Candidatus Bathyarchaeota archaeon]MDP7207349.1 M55 family metallopeptidase [Candidatus Bathyarchaeota archaeon]